MNIALYFGSILSLSMAASLVRWAQAPPDVIGAWRMTGASLLLLPFVIFSIKKNDKREETFHFLFQRSIVHVRLAIFSGVFFYFHLWTYFFAIHHTSIARAMIIFSINPLFATLGSRYYLKEKWPWVIFISFPLALIGVFILNGFQAPWMGWNRGDLSALASGVLYSFYILTGKKTRQVLSNLFYSYIIYTTAAIFFFGIGFLKGTTFFHYSNTTVWAILGTILIPTFCGHFLFSYLLRFFSPSFMSTGKLVEPFFASFMAHWFFQEPLNPQIGWAILLTGLAMFLLLYFNVKTS